jgi:hypothetical protein
MGIHDGGEWQLKVRSWELEIGRRVLWKEGGEEKKQGDFWRGRILERGIFGRGAQSSVASFH